MKFDQDGDEDNDNGSSGSSFDIYGNKPLRSNSAKDSAKNKYNATKRAALFRKKVVSNQSGVFHAELSRSTTFKRSNSNNMDKKKTTEFLEERDQI